MRQIRFLQCILFAFVCVSAHAEIYRWVDENGVVNYTQHKPEGRTSQTVSTRGGRPPAEETTEAVATPDSNLTEAQQRMLDELKAREAERAEQVAEIRRDNCEKSRSVLTRLTQSNRIRVRESGGTERVLPEEERQRRINEAQEGIATNCDSLDS